MMKVFFFFTSLLRNQFFLNPANLYQSFTFKNPLCRMLLSYLFGFKLLSRLFDLKSFARQTDEPFQRYPESCREGQQLQLSAV